MKPGTEQEWHGFAGPRLDAVRQGRDDAHRPSGPRQSASIAGAVASVRALLLRANRAAFIPAPA
jgi:hypothetical protein